MANWSVSLRYGGLEGLSCPAGGIRIKKKGLRMQQTDKQRLYWRRTQRVTAVLLALWFLVSFGVSYFGRELNFTFFGWPFSFWMAAQGSLIVFGLITAFYAWYMNRLDIQHGFQEDL